VTPRVAGEWHNRVVAEYRSAAITAQVLAGSIQFGFPENLQRTAIRIVGDELDHANLSHDAMVALGGAANPVALDWRQLGDPPSPDGPLAGLVDMVMTDFCCGETLAVPLFARMREGAQEPTARAVLDRVLRDEAVHRAFGWDALDALVAIEPKGVRHRITVKLPAVLQSFQRAYGTAHDLPPITPAERACGLIDVTEYVSTFEAALTDEILPRFARRGILVAGPTRTE
jgi:hypothetical protein